MATSLRDVITIDPACVCPDEWLARVMQAPPRALTDARTRGRTPGGWAVEVGALFFTDEQTRVEDMHIAVYMATLTAVLDPARLPHLHLEADVWRVVWASDR